MNAGDVQIRFARPADAATLSELANDLNDHVSIHGRPFTPERILTDGIGPQAAFSALVAELDGRVLGYGAVAADVRILSLAGDRLGALATGRR